MYGASKAFSTDGWEVARPSSPVVGVGFLPVADLRWLREADPPMAELYRTAGSDREPAVVDGAELGSWVAFADGLTIGVDHAPGLTCLVPFDGVEEWQVWNIHKETSQGFLSFRSLLEYQVAILEPISTLAELETVLVRAFDGDHSAIMRLRQTTAPEAVPRLVGLITDQRFGAMPVAALGRIGTAEAVEALAQLRSPQSASALGAAGTERARDVLAQWGEFYTPVTARRPSGRPDRRRPPRPPLGS